MPLTRVVCPNCSAVLNPAKPVREGARVKCPRCQGAFTAAAERRRAAADEPAEEEEEEDGRTVEAAEEDEVVAADDAPRENRRARDDEDDDRPARGKKGRGRDDDRPRKRKKGGVPLGVWMALGGVGLLLLVVCVGVGGYFGVNYFTGGAHVTLDDYGKIKGGMTEAEVTAILGPATNVLQDTKDIQAAAVFGNLRGLQWKNGDNTIVVNFTNDHVTTWSCLIDGTARNQVAWQNDRPNPPPPVTLPNGTITVANYNQIQKGMSEAQVKGVLGEPVNAMDAAGKRILVYQSFMQGSITITLEKGQVIERVGSINNNGKMTLLHGW